MGLFNKCLFLLDTSVLIKIVSLNIKHKPATVTMLVDFAFFNAGGALCNIGDVI